MRVTIQRLDTIEMSEENAEVIFLKHLDHICGGDQAFIDARAEVVTWEPDYHGSGGIERVLMREPSEVVFAAHKLRDAMRKEMQIKALKRDQASKAKKGKKK